MIRYTESKHQAGVWVMNIDGSGLTMLEAYRTSSQPEVGIWSPTGSHLLYRHLDHMRVDSYIVRAGSNGRGKTRITDEHGRRFLVGLALGLARMMTECKTGRRAWSTNDRFARRSTHRPETVGSDECQSCVPRRPRTEIRTMGEETMRRHIVTLALVAALCGGSQISAGKKGGGGGGGGDSASYTVVKLAPPGAGVTESWARDLDSSGNVVGYYVDGLNRRHGSTTT